jgi:hypothetical protein
MPSPVPRDRQHDHREGQHEQAERRIGRAHDAARPDPAGGQRAGAEDQRPGQRHPHRLDPEQRRHAESDEREPERGQRERRGRDLAVPGCRLDVDRHRVGRQVARNQIRNTRYSIPTTISVGSAITAA